uniref:PB1 domain-containing protein n=1 Tax=Palpitomonas bilix TaxID=652834 RepID=A0A7S3CVM7_9EUKA|mmetsp:Transcript_11218/g.29581  ORF Transcript_11218/g.29581 Transcript_11218/m.29581 type:complete len:741 (+) Transcript_11218:148-2370(+)
MVSVKVQYQKELRRLALDEDGVTYVGLAQRIEKLFGLNGRQFVVRYKDDEGEYITVDTDEEIRLALEIAESSDKRILRLDVELLPVEKTGQSLAEHLESLFSTLCDSIGIDKEVSERFVRSIVPDKVKEAVDSQKEHLSLGYQILDAFLAGNLRSLPFFPFCDNEKEDQSKDESFGGGRCGGGRRGRFWKKFSSWMRHPHHGWHGRRPGEEQGGQESSPHPDPHCHPHPHGPPFDPHHPPFGGPPHPHPFGGHPHPHPFGGHPVHPPFGGPWAHPGQGAPAAFGHCRGEKKEDETKAEASGSERSSRKDEKKSTHESHCSSGDMGGFHDFHWNGCHWNAKSHDMPRSVYKARFVADLTVFDGTVFKPSVPFTKIWKLRNTGDCAWPAGSTLQHISGPRLSGTASIPVPAANAGEEVDLSLDMTSPDTEGRYVSVWRLVTPLGKRFGQKVWVEIHVSTSDGIPASGEEKSEAARDRGDESGDDEEGTRKEEESTETCMEAAAEFAKKFGLNEEVAKGLVSAFPDQAQMFTSHVLPHLNDLTSQFLSHFPAVAEAVDHASGGDAEALHDLHALHALHAAHHGEGEKGMHDLHALHAAHTSHGGYPKQEEKHEHASRPKEGEEEEEKVEERKKRVSVTSIDSYEDVEEEGAAATAATPLSEKDSPLIAFHQHGYSDDELNQRVLVEYDGNVQAALGFLKKARQYHDEMEQLKSMGFLNEFENAQVLVSVGGKLSDAVNKLCPS